MRFFFFSLSSHVTSFFSMFSSFFYNALNIDYSLQSRRFICQFVLSVIYLFYVATFYLWHAIKFNNSLLMAMLYVSLFQAKNHSTNRERQPAVCTSQNMNVSRMSEWASEWMKSKRNKQAKQIKLKVHPVKKKKNQRTNRWSMRILL